MDQRIKRDVTLVNLVSDFESTISKGDLKFLDEKKFIQLVNYYEEEHLYENALEVLEIALEQYKYRSEFYIAKARLLLNLDQLEQAKKYLDKAESVAPFDFEIKILRAKLLSTDSRFVEALNMLDELKSGAKSFDLIEILISESFIFEKMKDFDSMFLSLSEALEINSSNHMALDRIWLSAELSRNYISSINLHKKILDKDPYNYMAWYNLGHAYSCIGEYENSIDALEYSFIINENFQNGYLDCADLCYQLKKYDRSLEHYQEAHELFGPDSEILISIAECLLHLDRIKECKVVLNQALKMDPYNEEVFFYLAQCYSKELSWFKAINAYHKAISIDDNREEYYLGLAKAYVAIENYENAIINFKKSTLTGLEQSIYWVEFVSFLIKRGLISDALTILDESEEYTFSADLLFCRAAIHFLTDDAAKGMDVLQEALLEDIYALDVFYNINPEFKIDPKTQSMIKYYQSELNII